MHRSFVLSPLFATTHDSPRLHAPLFISSRVGFISLPNRRSTIVAPGRPSCR